MFDLVVIMYSLNENQSLLEVKELTAYKNFVTIMTAGFSTDSLINSTHSYLNFSTSSSAMFVIDGCSL